MEHKEHSLEKTSHDKVTEALQQEAYRALSSLGRMPKHLLLNADFTALHAQRKLERAAKLPPAPCMITDNHSIPRTQVGLIHSGMWSKHDKRIR